MCHGTLCYRAAMSTLRQIGERELLRRLAALHGGSAAGVRIGAGDDAAVLAPAPGLELVVTVDAFVEGRHWRPGWIEPGALGARLAAANLSDLAAMGARPRWALLAHGLRGDHPADALIALQQGAARALGAHGAAIVGGNLTAVEGPAWSSLTLIGEAPAGRAWTRSGARPGDRLVVTGWPGRAGAAVRLAPAGGALAAHPALAAAWREPAPRVALALELAAAGGVRAAIDVSDGLAGDLATLAAAGGVGAALDARVLSGDAELARAADELGLEPLALALGPSDDYELLLAVAADRLAPLAAIAERHQVPFRVAGEVTPAGAGVVARLEREERPLAEIAAGFDHFRAE